MKKSLGLLSLMSLSASLFATPAHLTFFGDSLTDTGNFPEPANVADATLKNFNIYVPISNPVILDSTDPMNAFLTSSEGPLSKQGEINGETRAQYSINWPLYLTYALTKTSPKPLTTWFRHANSEATDTDNMNYAWASAVAGNPSGDPETMGECFHLSGHAYYGGCTVATMLADRKAYQAETSADAHFDKEHNYQAKILQVPDLNKQVSLYLNDFKAHLPDNNAIFIYIGGNDISDYLKAHLIEAGLDKEDDFMSKYAEPQVKIVASYVKQAVDQIKKSYGSDTSYHIYIMSLPHLSNLHEAYDYRQIPVLGPKLIKVLDATVDAYNADLKALFPGDAQVTFVDSGSQINGWASSDTYQPAIAAGKVCSQEAAYLTPSASGTNDCQYQSGMSDNYFSWNDAHFTAPVNNTLAEYMAGFVK